MSPLTRYVLAIVLLTALAIPVAVVVGYGLAAGIHTVTAHVSETP